MNKLNYNLVILPLKSYKWIFRGQRLNHSLTKEDKTNSDVLKFIQSTNEYKIIKDDLPKALLRKYKTPESMYLVNRDTAKVIAHIIEAHLKPGPIVEVNPGFCFLSRELIQCKIGHLYLYETSNYFTDYLKNLHNENPNKITYKVADFFGMWKLAFQDKMDDGCRIQELLGVLATDDNDREVKIVGSMPGISFVRHLINNIVFHNTSNHLGRPDLFITMPGHHYEFLTDTNIQMNKHRSIPALFQLLFDYKILKKVPKVHFLPWTYLSTGKNVSLMDEYCLYLVNITQKKVLPCQPDYLPLLWYFFKPHMLSKSTRVIPMLEQWIPGCGVWLITGQDPPDTNKLLAPNEDDAQLPHMTIFTQFGDLNLKQKLTVFKRFISWPEFEQCQFRLTMENNLPKFVTALDVDDKDSIGTHIEDIEHSDVENET